MQARNVFFPLLLEDMYIDNNYALTCDFLLSVTFTINSGIAMAGSSLDDAARLMMSLGFQLKLFGHHGWLRCSETCTFMMSYR